jgi:FkbM family methyltransferase
MVVIFEFETAGLLMKFIKLITEIVKKIPGVKWCYRSFILTPGSFVFTSRNLEWINTPSYYEQLPGILKFYSFCCRFLPRIDGKIVGAEHLYMLISFIVKLFGMSNNYVIIDNGYHIFLLLTDPRSLVVPLEIKTSKEISVLKEYLKEGDTFVDIGANHGSFSLVASKLVGSSGKIIAIEPQPALADLIEKSMSANNAAPFEVYQLACSDHNGSENFYIPKSTSGSAGLFKNFSSISASDVINVTLKTFDTLAEDIKFNGNVFFKLDVEGSEFKFLKGAESTIRHLRPSIMIEINPSSFQAAGVNLEEMIKFLELLGYSEYREIDHPARLAITTLNKFKQQNIILLP